MSTTETLTLADFLLARIAEDEAAAQAAARDLASHSADDRRSGKADLDWHAIESYEPVAITMWANEVHWVHFDDDRETDMTRHVTRWNSARVLAECEAKRRIVEQWAAVPDWKRNGPAPAEWYDGAAVGLELAVRRLALPYADHPDYREEWKP